MASLASGLIELVATYNIAGLGGASPRVARDRAGDSAVYPLLTFVDPISSVPVLSGNGQTMARTRRVQFDLWQNRASEDYSLVSDLVKALDGKQFSGTFADTGDGAKVLRTRVADFRRVYDPMPDLVHHVIDVMVTHMS